MSARAKVLLLALLQSAVLLAWAGYHEHLWATGATFRLALLPDDPYDALRGRYFILRPETGEFDTRKPDEGARLAPAAVERFLGAEKYFNGTAQVGFCPEPGQPGRERVCALAHPGAPRPRGAVHWSTAKVRAMVCNEPCPQPCYSGEIDLGLDRFFLPDRTRLPGKETDSGWEVEVVHRPGQRPLAKRLWFQGKAIDLG